MITDDTLTEDKVASLLYQNRQEPFDTLKLDIISPPALHCRTRSKGNESLLGFRATHSHVWDS
jgi:hypothetical protein